MELGSLAGCAEGRNMPPSHIDREHYTILENNGTGRSLLTPSRAKSIIGDLSSSRDRGTRFVSESAWTESVTDEKEQDRFGG